VQVKHRTKRLNWACIETVDDVQGSRENSNCGRIGREWNSGIPRGQEKIFSCVQLIGTQWARFSLVHF
jgi:hypothetical protein